MKQRIAVDMDGVMADVVPTPHYYVVPNFHEGLDGVVLKNEAVLANNHIAPDKSS